MFGIGFQELVLLSLIGLIVLGPERLPRVANQIGGWLGQARRMTRVMKRQLEDEINFERDLNIKTPRREPSTQPAPKKPAGADDHDAPADASADLEAVDSDAGHVEDNADPAITAADGRAIEDPLEAPAETGDTDEPVTKETP